jgi:hypothetical protein
MEKGKRKGEKRGKREGGKWNLSRAKMHPLTLLSNDPRSGVSHFQAS